MKRFLLGGIRFYRKHISKRLPKMCKYYPTCSAYAMEAIEVHGALIGSLLAIRRLMRCNVFFPGGFDPVPPRRERNDRPPRHL